MVQIVEHENHEARERHAAGGRGIVRPKLRPAVGLGDPFEPEFVVEPAVHVKHVPHDEDERDHTGPALERVAPIRAVAVGGLIRHTACDNHEADDGMEQDRNEDEHPFNKRQHAA
jgi:hypothetical protein